MHAVLGHKDKNYSLQNETGVFVLAELMPDASNTARGMLSSSTYRNTRSYDLASGRLYKIGTCHETVMLVDIMYTPNGTINFNHIRCYGMNGSYYAKAIIPHNGQVIFYRDPDGAIYVKVNTGLYPKIVMYIKHSNPSLIDYSSSDLSEENLTLVPVT